MYQIHGGGGGGSSTNMLISEKYSFGTSIGLLSIKELTSEDWGLGDMNKISSTFYIPNIPNIHERVT